jgi:hypothetical protein
MKELYHQLNSISKVVGKSYTSSYFSSFFFLIAIPSVYTNEILSSVFAKEYSDGKVRQ